MSSVRFVLTVAWPKEEIVLARYETRDGKAVKRTRMIEQEIGVSGITHALSCLTGFEGNAEFVSLEAMDAEGNREMICQRGFTSTNIDELLFENAVLEYTPITE
jgi:hypothetical protein